MTHHILRDIDQKHLCLYCGLNLSNNEWNSEFHLTFHYKTTRCKCGKKIRRKSSIMGSGHNIKTENSIEELVKDVKGPEIIKKGK